MILSVLLILLLVVLTPMGSAAQAADPFVPLYEIASTQAWNPVGFFVLSESPGDFNGDGFDDFAIGTPGWNFSVGRARVYSGIGGIVLAQFEGDPLLSLPPSVCGAPTCAGETFGKSVLLADLDADGVAELAVGAPQSSSVTANPLTIPGRVAVLKYGVPVPIASLVPSIDGTQFGERLGAVGDLNGDGWPDLLVSAPGYDIPGAGFFNTGAVWALSGPNLATTLAFVAGVQPGEGYGGTLLDGGLTGVGDVNADGAPDWTTASPSRDSLSGPDSGLVQVFSGATGAILFQWSGNSPFQVLGNQVEALGDVNGDSVPDLAFTDTPIAFFNPSPHHLYVVSGATGAFLYVLSSAAGLGSLMSLGRVSDVTGDGADEILIGQITGPPTSPVNRVTVRSGATGAQVFEASCAGCGGFGRFVAGAGDLNSDGLGDFLFTWHDAPLPGTSVLGKVLVYAARNLAVVGTPTVGGTLAFSLTVPRWPNRPFVLAFSQGNGGFLLGPYWVPVTPDFLFLSTLEAGLGGTLTSSGQGSFTMPIPNDPSLHGTTVYASGGVFDATPAFAIRTILTATTISIP